MKLIASTLILLALSSPVSAAEVDKLRALPDGTTLLSINRDPRLNTSPGTWNHAAIVANGHIVESQAGIVERGQGKGVINTTFADFLSRDYSKIIALVPLDSGLGERAADRADQFVGLPFRKLSSLPRRETPRREKRGMNCNSTVRAAFVDAGGPKMPKQKIPDRFLAMRGKLYGSATITIR